VTPRRIVVVGASLAGLRTVEALRREGFDGEIVVLGAEEHLPYDRPPLSKAVLAGKWDADRTALRKPESYAELGAEWRLGAPATGIHLEERAVLANGERVPFDAAVIATGAAPRSLPGSAGTGSAGMPGVHVLRTIDDSLAIRSAFDAGARVAVVGAGFIGGEVAATARARGLDVAMIEALPVPLEHSLGADMGRVVAQVHRDHGVDVRLGASVEAIEGSGRVERVKLRDGSHVDADVVVVGIGVSPVTGWLEGSGLALSDGVVCDQCCRATLADGRVAPGVFAVGDVARWTNPRFGESMRIEHWTHATESADAVAAALLAGEDAEPYAPIPYFWSDQFDVKIQYAGRARPDDEMVVVDGDVEERRFVALYGRGDRLTGVLGFSRPRLVMKYRRMMRDGTTFQEATREAEG
jgi:NADPH-dependent 2,4-dienoyl-CoA reductase/sulfur reductase-like enzyme